MLFGAAELCFSISETALLAMNLYTLVLISRPQVLAREPSLRRRSSCPSKNVVGDRDANHGQINGLSSWPFHPELRAFWVAFWARLYS